MVQYANLWPRKAIRRSRDNAWKVIDTRRHEVLKVYTTNTEADDLLLIGRVTVGYKNGETKEGEFIGRIKISYRHISHPRTQLYKVWMI